MMDRAKEQADRIAQLEAELEATKKKLARVTERRAYWFKAWQLLKDRSIGGQV